MNIKRLKAILDELKEAFPNITVELASRDYAGPTVAFHRVKTYADANALMRSFGVGDRDKAIINNRLRFTLRRC